MAKPEMSKEEVKKYAELVKNTAKSKRRCLVGDHPRDKVFTYTHINSKELQAQIDLGNIVVGCRNCRTTYVKEVV